MRGDRHDAATVQVRCGGCDRRRVFHIRSGRRMKRRGGKDTQPACDATNQLLRRRSHRPLWLHERCIVHSTFHFAYCIAILTLDFSYKRCFLCNPGIKKANGLCGHSLASLCSLMLHRAPSRSLALSRFAHLKPCFPPVFWHRRFVQSRLFVARSNSIKCINQVHQ